MEFIDATAFSTAIWTNSVSLGWSVALLTLTLGLFAASVIGILVAARRTSPATPVLHLAHPLPPRAVLRSGASLENPERTVVGRTRAVKMAS